MTKILGHWVHAHERDTGGEKVFVDAGEALPPSRGRQHWAFRADGTYVDGGPGADDRAVQASGTYEFDGGTLVLTPGQGGSPVTYAVAGGSQGSLKFKLKG